ncbi:hypothetical protein [Nocardioides terrisoli]|uniref:hypothetical protein n=1 Tax=Nocardioides terrisoli TaxID=3388267 RepID=UPI00287B7B2E|nr:hypothetical protein [Nocardioides marmorisolisilvae]
MTYDGAVWGSLACALSALGAVLTYLAWQRRGPRAALRGVAWTLLPVAAWLTGTLRLATEVIGDVGDWAARVVFSPAVWLGICLAGVSAVLFGVSGALRRRAGGRPARGDRRATRPGKERRSVARRPEGPADDDMDEISAILKKHGIS